MHNRPRFHDSVEEHARLLAIRARIDARLRRLGDRINPEVQPFERLGRLALIATLAEGGAHG